MSGIFCDIEQGMRAEAFCYPQHMKGVKIKPLQISVDTGGVSFHFFGNCTGGLLQGRQKFHGQLRQHPVSNKPFTSCVFIQHPPCPMQATKRFDQ